MNIKKVITKALLCAGIIFSMFSQANAGLIGVDIGLPDILSDSVGTYSYNAATNNFNSAANSLTITFDGTTITPITNNGNNKYSLNMMIDNAGNFISGVAGDDLMITGDIDIDGDGVNEYSGTLLTGEVNKFGFEKISNYMLFDMTFNVTGGAIAPLFAGKMGADVFVSEKNNFTAWTVNHAGTKVKHDTAPVPEPSTLLLLGSGLASIAFLIRKRES